MKRKMNTRYASRRVPAKPTGYCINCNAPYYGTNKNGQWWFLRDYFKAPDGLYCPKCYDLVAHDAYQNPKNPKTYERLIIMHALKNR